MTKMNDIPIRSMDATRNEPDLSESFCIRDVREVLAGKDMVQELHRHDYFFILALKKGKGNHEIDFTSYEVCDNSLFFMRPGQVHQLELQAGSSGYLMQFKPDFYGPDDKATGQLLRRMSNKSLCQIDAERAKKLFVILTSVFKEYSEKQEGYPEVIKANLGIFLIEFGRHRQKKKSPLPDGTLYTQKRIEELSELIEANFTTHKHVFQYAAMLNLSSYQLNRFTKTTLGKKCSELINDYIILEAKRLLLATSNQVNQIASQLGYDDVSYFIRFFKKHSGFSPDTFRHNFK
jgi:AraC family transcriptional regulator, transcriptional activator of pobA